MFTGLIQQIGVVAALGQKKMMELTLRAPAHPEPYVLGESIAIDGCCLTVVEATADTFRVEASPETLRRTTLGLLKPGAPVNLERAMRLGDRLGGHLVQGHVDGVAEVVGKRPEGGSLVMDFSLPKGLCAYFIEKGSVAVDGVSLTVNTLEEDRFSVALIPETQDRTGLAAKAVGAKVNLEADLIGKYVARLYLTRSAGGLSEETLRAAGFAAKE